MKRRCLGVLGGEAVPLHALHAWAESADFVVAADGGWDHLKAAGLSANAVVGDLDSIRSTPSESVATVHDSDPNRSDADKLLAYASSGAAGSVTLICGHGGRIDHLLATFSSAFRSGLCVQWAFPEELVRLVRPGVPSAMTTIPGQRVSLLPLLPCSGATLQGVRWPLERVELRMDGLISLSNEATGENVVAEIEDGAALLFLGRPITEPPLWPTS